MKRVLLLFSLVLPLSLLSQEQPEMADALRQDGKFWVVVVCLSIILLGILSYLILLDRKVTKMEKEHFKK